MNIISRVFGAGRSQAMSAGVAARLRKKSLRRQIAGAVGEERALLEEELALVQAEASAKTKQKLAHRHLGRKSPQAGPMVREAAAAESTLGTIKARLAGMLGFTAPATPSHTPPPPGAPPVPAAAAAGADYWRTVNASSSPEEVEAALQDLCTAFPGRALGADWHKDPAAIDRVLARVDVIGDFLKAVGQVDPSGRVIERVDQGTPAERKEAARVVGGILARLAGAERPAAGNPATSKPDSGLRGLDRVRAAFAKDRLNPKP